MDSKTIAEMTGQAGQDRIPAFKLNEVRLNGDSGNYSVRKLLEEKGEDGRYPVEELGNKLYGVILKKRWRLYRYEENKQSIMSSEFDIKSKDMVVIFGSNEKGLAADLKEKYKLGTQCVLYTYFPNSKELRRVIVKASALTGDKNPDPEEQLGLFEYLDTFDWQGNEHPFQYLTEFASVYREDPVNKRKSYWVMTFKRGKRVEPENEEAMLKMLEEVHEKTKMPFAEKYAGPESDGKGMPANHEGEYPTEDINPDDIPF